MDLGLAGRTALVTGASKGIGRATAELLAREGASVCVVARHAEPLEEAARQIAEATGGTVVALVGDVGDPAAPRRVVDVATERLGPIDVLVNNSGGPPPGTYADHDEQAWDQALATLLRGSMRFIEAVAPGMGDRGWGRIVNVSSTIMREPAPQMVLSAAPRAALAAYAKALAAQLAPVGVTVNTVLPANVLTDRAVSLIQAAADRQGITYDEALRDAQAALPSGRMATAGEVAALIGFLASDQAGYVSGTAIAVDGALTKSLF